MKRLVFLTAVILIPLILVLTACGRAKYKGLSLLERYDMNDPRVAATEVQIVLPVFDESLIDGDFVARCRYIEKDAEGHRFKFEILGAIIGRDVYKKIENGAILYTDPEPYDLIVEDKKTHEKEYRYQSVMGSEPYEAGEEYIMIGYFHPDEKVPVLFYGLYAPINDFASVEFWGRNIYTGGEDYPPSKLQLNACLVGSEYEQFFTYCSAGINGNI